MVVIVWPTTSPFAGKTVLGQTWYSVLVESSLVERSQRARFPAAQAPHSGDWLLALPIANCGLRLDDEAVRVAVPKEL